jgi:hypothetical protein
MKAKVLFLVALLSGSLNSFGQSVDKTLYDNIYYFLTSEALVGCDAGGNVASPAPAATDIAAQLQFKITKILDDGSFVIQFLRFGVENKDAVSKTRNTALNTKLYSSNTDQTTGAPVDPDIYFHLPLKVFTNECDLRLNRHSFTIGALVMPIKLRFGAKSGDGTQRREFTFTNDVSIGLSIGFKYAPNKKYAHNFLTGISLTSVGVTPDDTKGAVTTATNLSAITWHLGYLFQIDNFQVGAFTGVDYLAGKPGRMWDYKNEMWFGIGVGYSIFSSKKTTDTQ